MHILHRLVCLSALISQQVAQLSERDRGSVFITGPPNGPVLFCSLVSVVVCRLSSSVALPANGPAAGHVRGRAADTSRRASTVTSR